MLLTQAQQTALKIHIEANTNPAVIAALSGGSHSIIAIEYNKDSDPAYHCWRSSMPVSEVRGLIDWSEVVDPARTTNDLLAFQILTNANSVDPSKLTVRQAFASIFSGTEGDVSRAALLAAAYRIVTLGEQVLALSLGDGTTGDPDSFGFEGNLIHQDISKALING